MHAMTYEKVENDLLLAEKSAIKKQKQLEKTAAEKKAGDVVALEGGAGATEEGGDIRDYSSSGTAVNITAELTKRSAEEIFAQFDTDGSGLIDFDEFRAMLPQLGIRMSMPKVRYGHRAKFGVWGEDNGGLYSATDISRAS